MASPNRVILGDTMQKNRKLIISILVGIFMTVGFIGYAAETKRTSPAPVPMRPPPASVKMIWDYKQDIGLTDTQLDEIHQSYNEFQKQLIQLRSKIQVSQLDLQDLLDKKADLTVIKDKLTEIAGLQVDYQLLDISTSRKIEGILTPDQYKKWRAILVKETERINAPARPATKNQ